MRTALPICLARTPDNPYPRQEAYSGNCLWPGFAFLLPYQPLDIQDSRWVAVRALVFGNTMYLTMSEIDPMNDGPCGQQGVLRPYEISFSSCHLVALGVPCVKLSMGVGVRHIVDCACRQSFRHAIACTGTSNACRS